MLIACNETAHITLRLLKTMSHQVTPKDDTSSSKAECVQQWQQSEQELNMPQDFETFLDINLENLNVFMLSNCCAENSVSMSYLAHWYNAIMDHASRFHPHVRFARALPFYSIALGLATKYGRSVPSGTYGCRQSYSFRFPSATTQICSRIV